MEGRTTGDAGSLGPATGRTGATQAGASMSGKDSGSTADRGVGRGTGTGIGGGAVVSDGLGYEAGGADGSLVGISRGGTGVAAAPAVTFRMLALL